MRRLNLLFGLVTLVAAVLGVFITVKPVSAASDSTQGGVSNPWSLSVARFVSVGSESPAVYGGLSTCDGGSVGPIWLQADHSTHTACIFGNAGGIRMARYASNLGGFGYAITFPHSDSYYNIKGLCGGFYGCEYAPSTDMFIDRPIANSWSRSLLIYKSFLGQLKRYTNELTQEVYYRHEATIEPVTLTLADGSVAYSEAATFSSDGRWLVAELRALGLVRIDPKTLDFTRVSAPGFSNGYTTNGQTELTISNDGQYIAFMGMNRGAAVITVDSTCGDVPTSYASVNFASDATACRLDYIDTSAVAPALWTASFPSFSPDGHRLYCTIIARSGVYSRVVYSSEVPKLADLAGSASGDKTNTANSGDGNVGSAGSLSYIALGDSYVSGEGETDDNYYLPATNTVNNKCHVSKRSYPYLVATSWQVVGNNAACSGATTKDILGDQAKYGQVALVASYLPDAVTVGIGGNDAGLIDKLRVCLGFDECEWAANTGGDNPMRSSVAIELQQVSSKLRAVITKIKSISPKTRIAVVGYPSFIKASADCPGIIGTLLQPSERLFASKAIEYLNTVLASTAAAEGVAYVDISDSYKGRVLCDKNSDAMNGLRVGNDIAPISWLSFLKVIGSESFHPTPLGHSLAAAAIAKQIPTLPSLSQCDCTTCNCQANYVPPADSYWGNLTTIGASYGVDTDSNQTVHQPARLKPDTKLYKPQQTMNIVATKNTFEPNSVVQAEIHSTAHKLASLQAAADGSIDATATIPADIPDGYHMLHLFGVDMTGQPVDAYRLITIQQRPDDTANDSVPLADPGTGQQIKSILGASTVAGFDPNPSVSTFVTTGQAAAKTKSAKKPQVLGANRYLVAHNSNRSWFVLGVMVCLGLVGGLGGYLGWRLWKHRHR